jgi:hypothetical protein
MRPWESGITQHRKPVRHQISLLFLVLYHHQIVAVSSDMLTAHPQRLTGVNVLLNMPIV